LATGAEFQIEGLRRKRSWNLNQWALPILILWSLLSTILVFMTQNETPIKWGSVLASLLPLGLSIYMLAGYDHSQGDGVRRERALDRGDQLEHPPGGGQPGACR
jgi:peptidoglycan/LPS O-acetylase OafA/YrhL